MQGSDNFDKMKQGNNTAKNKQFRDALRQLEKDYGKKLDKQELHDYITQQGLNGYSEIYEAGLELFGPCP